MPRFASREGQWFAVPLDDGRYAVGLVARDSRTGVLLGYFFGPAREAPPELAEVVALRAEDAVLVAHVGHLGLRSGRWPVVGSQPGWDRAAWPSPGFVRHEELTGRTLEVTYADDDPGAVVAERVLPAGEEAAGPEDGLMGAVFAERRLSTLLASEGG